MKKKLVREVSMMLLKEKPVVSLLTDADEPIPNHVYTKIGFSRCSEWKSVKAKS